MNVAELKKRILRGFAYPELFYMPASAYKGIRIKCGYVYPVVDENENICNNVYLGGISSGTVMFACVNITTGDKYLISDTSSSAPYYRLPAGCKYKIKMIMTSRADTTGGVDGVWHEFEINKNGKCTADPDDRLIYFDSAKDVLVIGGSFSVLRFHTYFDKEADVPYYLMTGGNLTAEYTASDGQIIYGSEVYSNIESKGSWFADVYLDGKLISEKMVYNCYYYYNGGAVGYFVPKYPVFDFGFSIEKNDICRGYGSGSYSIAPYTSSVTVHTTGNIASSWTADNYTNPPQQYVPALNYYDRILNYELMTDDYDGYNISSEVSVSGNTFSTSMPTEYFSDIASRNTFPTAKNYKGIKENSLTPIMSPFLGNMRLPTPFHWKAGSDNIYYTNYATITAYTISGNICQSAIKNGSEATDYNTHEIDSSFFDLYSLFYEYDYDKTDVYNKTTYNYTGTTRYRQQWIDTYFRSVGSGKYYMNTLNKYLQDVYGSSGYMKNPELREVLFKSPVEELLYGSADFIHCGQYDQIDFTSYGGSTNSSNSYTGSSFYTRAEDVYGPSFIYKGQTLFYPAPEYGTGDIYAVLSLPRTHKSKDYDDWINDPDVTQL